MVERRIHFATKEALMASPFWQQLKRRVVASQEFCCDDCGERRKLELHHEVYPWHKMIYKDPGRWGDEEDDDVVGLCRECHHERHRDLNGDFWSDPLEMESWWAGYYAEMQRP